MTRPVPTESHVGRRRAAFLPTRRPEQFFPRAARNLPGRAAQRAEQFLTDGKGRGPQQPMPQGEGRAHRICVRQVKASPPGDSHSSPQQGREQDRQFIPPIQSPASDVGGREEHGGRESELRENRCCHGEIVRIPVVERQYHSAHGHAPGTPSRELHEVLQGDHAVATRKERHLLSEAINRHMQPARGDPRRERAIHHAVIAQDQQAVLPPRAVAYAVQDPQSR